MGRWLEFAAAVAGSACCIAYSLVAEGYLRPIPRFASPCIAENFGTWLGLRVVSILPPLLLLLVATRFGVLALPPHVRGRIQFLGGALVIGLVVPAGGIPIRWGIWEAGLGIVVSSAIGLGSSLVLRSETVGAEQVVGLGGSREMRGGAAWLAAVGILMAAAAFWRFAGREQAGAQEPKPVDASVTEQRDAQARQDPQLRSTLPITVVIFTDFQCPYCRRLFAELAPQLELLESQRPELLTVRTAQLPLDMSCNSRIQRTLHSAACRAAIVAELAIGKGHDRYVVERTLFDAQAHLDEDLKRIALEWGVVPEPTASGEWSQALEKVDRDVKWAAALGIDSTPTAFVNGYRVARVSATAVMAAVAVEQRRVESARQ